MSLIYLAAIIIFLTLVFIFLFRGILGFVFLATIAGGLVKLKMDEIKNKGVNRFGSTLAFVLKPEVIIIGNKEFMTASLKDLKIGADDYMCGTVGDIFSSSLGTDNFIELHKKERNILNNF